MNRISYCFDSARFVGLDDLTATRLQQAHPGISVPLEVERAASWLFCARRKMRRPGFDAPAFLRAFLARGQRRAAERSAIVARLVGGAPCA